MRASPQKQSVYDTIVPTGLESGLGAQFGQYMRPQLWRLRTGYGMLARDDKGRDRIDPHAAAVSIAVADRLDVGIAGQQPRDQRCIQPDPVRNIGQHFKVAAPRRNRI